jgi:putative restriction endonuclease
VDADLAARLSPSHIRRLEWFEEHAGEVGPRPGHLAGSLPLVHPQMGIYKPRELNYATAIVTMISSPYPGDRVTHHADGTWDMIYHQQDGPSGQDTATYTNEALRACLRDRIPGHGGSTNARSCREQVGPTVC